MADAEIKFLDGDGTAGYRRSDVTGASSGTPATLANNVTIRDDALSALSAAELTEYIPLRADSTGSLWTRVTDIVPGTGATNLGKAADSAAGATDTGVAPLAVVDAALTAITPIDGDYAPVRVDANGALWVKPSGTVTVAGTVDLGATDNAVLDNIETNTDFGTVVGGGLQAGALRVTLASDSTGVVSVDDGGTTISVDDGSGSLTVDGTISVGGASFAAAEDAALPDEFCVIAGDDGTDTRAVQIDPTSGALSVVLRAGTAAVGKLSPNTGVDIGEVSVSSGSITETNSTAILADTASMDTNLGTLAGAVTGTEMQVDVVTDLPLARTVDAVGAALQTDAMMDGATAVTPKFATITATASGNTAVVALVAGKKIRVLSYTVGNTGASTVDVKFQSNTTDITGLMPLATDSAGSPAFCPYGLFETVAGEALNINLSAAIAVGGHITYIEV